MKKIFAGECAGIDTNLISNHTRFNTLDDSIFLLLSDKSTRLERLRGGMQIW